MVTRAYTFRDASDRRGTPTLRLNSTDLVYAGLLYDALREQFADLTLTHYPNVFDKSIPIGVNQPLKDGQHLQERLQHGSCELRQAYYIATLGGQQAAVVLEYASQSRRSDRPFMGHREPPCRSPEPANLWQLQSLTLVNRLQAIEGQTGRTWGWQWQGERKLDFTNDGPVPSNFDFLTRWAARRAARFAQCAKIAMPA